MKHILILSLITITALSSRACDICGCGIGSNYIGILPDFNSRIFSVRYRHNMLQTHLGAGGEQTYLTTKEIYRVAELWGGWNIGKHFRVMASVPVSFNERINQGTSQSKNGLGDVSVNGYYELINKRSALKNNDLLVQSLWIGGGVKLPTGKYEPADKSNGSTNTNLFQLGTASTDFLFNAMYDIRLQDVGMNLNTSYKINTANKYDYRYGNKFSAAAQWYYKFRFNNKLMLAPNVGLQYESSEKDIDKPISVDISGGNILSGTAGLEIAFSKMAIGGNIQTPFSQRLANDIVRSGNRAMVHVSFTF